MSGQSSNATRAKPSHRTELHVQSVSSGHECPSLTVIGNQPPSLARSRRNFVTDLVIVKQCEVCEALCEVRVKILPTPGRTRNTHAQHTQAQTHNKPGQRHTAKLPHAQHPPSDYSDSGRGPSTHPKS